MSNEFYNHAGYPTTNSAGASANMRAELDSIAAGFDKLPALSGNALKVIRVNAGGTALEASNAISIPVTSYILKGDGAGGMTTATSGTDYAPATSGTSLLKGNGAGGFSSAGAVPTGLVKGDGSTLSAAVAGTDYQSAQSVTGIVKSSGTTRSAAVAGSDYIDPASETDVTGAITHTETTLTDGANIDWNLDTQQNAKVTLGGNRVMNAPTNAKAGRFVALRVIQDGTGGRTLTFNAAYKGMTGITPTTTAGAVNFYLFRCIDTTNLALVGFRSNCEA